MNVILFTLSLPASFQHGAHGNNGTRTLQLIDGGIVSVTGGVNCIANEKWRLTDEVGYSWMSVV